MKKKILYLLITCFVIMAENIVQAAIPITPSTNTGEGAVWYRIKNSRALSQGRAAYMKADNYDTPAVMADITESDNFLWCFVGDETNGFQIYNKALLANDSRLVSVEGGNGAAKVVSAVTPWEYTWAIHDDDGSFGLLPGTTANPGSATNNNYLHGTLDNGIIFYGHSATEGGSAWIFEDATIPVTVDF